jgi:Raf kinase inhibitor-like YbhB/YbcL family protein
VRITSDSFPDGGTIPDRHALGTPHPEQRVVFSDNINPHLAWTDPPAGTRSFALVCHDPDVPSVGDDVNQADRTVPHDLPRTDFFHWVVVDIPPDVREIPEGAVSRGVIARGKPAGADRFGRVGRNDYTGWFSGDDQMDGAYHGYDGPGPPWNDERLHHYHFTIFALDTDRLDLPEGFGGEDVRRAMEGHVLDKAEWVGTYSLNPHVRGS